MESERDVYIRSSLEIKECAVERQQTAAKESEK